MIDIYSIYVQNIISKQNICINLERCLYYFLNRYLLDKKIFRLHKYLYKIQIYLKIKYQVIVNVRRNRKQDAEIWK